MAPTDDMRSYIVARYVALSERDQIPFLAKLANNLTIEGRATYDLQGGVADSARLRCVNEAQHRILAQLLHLLRADERRYPDDVFANILADQFAALRLDAEFVRKLME